MRFRYDLAPETPAPAEGDLLVAYGRAGAPTGTWYLIVAVRPVAHRRPRAWQGWALEVVRQDGPPPEAAGLDADGRGIDAQGRRHHPVTSYPRGVDLDEYWAARQG